MEINQCKAKGGRWDEIKKKCYIPTKGNYKLKPHNFNVARGIITILLIFALGLSTIIFTNAGTMLHEFAGHTLVAKLLGCDANWHTDTYTGTTTFDNCKLQKNTDKVCTINADCGDSNTATNDRCINGKCVLESKMTNILIGLAAIFVVFFAALAIWIFLDKDSIWRVIAILIMLYSCIPSAFPLMPGSDMAYVVGQGFPIWLAWTLYVLMAGVFMWLLVNEVTDKPYFRRLLE